MINSFTNLIETSSSGGPDGVTNEDKLKSVDNIIEALNCVSDEYAACEANVNDVIAQCELELIDACYKCERPKIHFKSTKLSSSPPDLQGFRDALAVEPQDGYCERNLQNMNVISNQNICSGVSSEIAFLYTVNFGVNRTMDMTFHIPVDFGYGGYALLDGEVKAEHREDVWEDGDELEFTASVVKGAHLLEVIGGEDCCDGEREWAFEIGENPGVKE